MKVYLAYASDDPEYNTLIGVYHDDILAARKAHQKALEMDEMQREIFADDDHWEFIPATWGVVEKEVIEE